MKQRSIQNERAAFDQIFKAVGDPHRLKIIQLLAEQELNAGELLQSIDIVQSTLSHHMKCLVESGIVNARRNGKWTCYTLNPEVIHDAYDFLGQYLDGTKKTGTAGGTQTAGADPSAAPVKDSRRPAAQEDESAAKKQEERARRTADRMETAAEAEEKGKKADDLPKWWKPEEEDDDEEETSSGGWWKPEQLSERMDGKKAGKKHSGELNAARELSRKVSEEEKKKKGKKSKKGKKNSKK
jgi:ArsR family transcriptional regulator